MLLDCEEVRRNVRVVVVGEAHIIVDWQVFNICFYFFTICYCDSEYR